uniref:Actin-like ATPase domain-containing protein n=1 Tax=Rhizophagus irregularis (strain DAOM 181602 / DAOM 197198 / MUCL 43194) TaxID=747089 RepID=U9U290_RHIID
MDELIFVYSGSCSSLLRNLSSIGTTFVVVNCGGGTLDLTTRKLVGNNPLQLSEVTERSGDFCGRDNREFNYELDVRNISPSLLQYVSESGREWMGEWVIKINYNGIKSMFDPVIDRIINLIRIPTNKQERRIRYHQGDDLLSHPHDLEPGTLSTTWL